jgi:hypothetical protein
VCKTSQTGLGDCGRRPSLLTAALSVSLAKRDAAEMIADGKIVLGGVPAANAAEQCRPAVHEPVSASSAALDRGYARYISQFPVGFDPRIVSPALRRLCGVNSREVLAIG